MLDEYVEVVPGVDIRGQVRSSGTAACAVAR